ncbi:hypothetical protein [Candidatus Laterigemmans baculatus]|uniref:hypothetical protein n=1 Tax=Candidatus Laterigemmans baculatus TaxID=2770505 RepID=UPI0013DB853D|nr:hypothetical protein [Candidatus Laterigemmans baculatus]
MSDPQAILRPLAERCVESADHQGRTPVIAVERGLALAPEFYVALATELQRAAGRSLRFEVLVDLERSLGPWRARAAKRQAEAIRNALLPVLGPAPAVETRTVLSRPAGAQRPLVVGFGAVHDSVPAWAAVLRLTCRPTTLDDFQLIPAAA